MSFTETTTLDTQWMSSFAAMDQLDTLMPSEPWSYVPTCTVTVGRGAVLAVAWGETLALTAEGTLQDPQKLVDAYAGKTVSEVLLFHVNLPADHIQVFTGAGGEGTRLLRWVSRTGSEGAFVPVGGTGTGAVGGCVLGADGLATCSRATFAYTSVPVFHDINTLFVVVREEGRNQRAISRKKVRFLGGRTTKKKHLE